MSIKNCDGVISRVTDLSKTAKEVEVRLKEGLSCPAGSFVNFFMKVNGTEVRRAYSVVHADETACTVTLSIRHTLNGTMTPEFWKDDIVGREVRIMGPMGQNTADKFTHENVLLFAYGIGAGVIRAVLEYALTQERVRRIVVVTGSRNEEDIIYKEFFDDSASKDSRVEVKYVISDPLDPQYPFIGYVQDHIDDVDCNNADIYMCGQEKACNALLEKIKAKNPSDMSFFVEAFH